MVHDELQKVANKFIIQTRTGQLIATTVDMKRYKESLKYQGLLIIAVDKETNLDRAVMKYRSRETIEEGIEGRTGHTGGDARKCGKDDSVDGKLLVKFLGNSMCESMRSKFREMERTPAIPNGDADHDQKINLQTEAKVKNMIPKKSMVNILESFEWKHVTVIGHGQKTYEIIMSKTKRDAIFLKLFADGVCKIAMVS